MTIRINFVGVQSNQSSNKTIYADPATQTFDYDVEFVNALATSVTAVLSCPLASGQTVETRTITRTKLTGAPTGTSASQSGALNQTVVFPGSSSVRYRVSSTFTTPVDGQGTRIVPFAFTPLFRSVPTAGSTVTSRAAGPQLVLSGVQKFAAGTVAGVAMLDALLTVADAYGVDDPHRSAAVRDWLTAHDVKDLIDDYELSRSSGSMLLGSPAVGAIAAVRAAVVDSGTQQTIITGITNPETPRCVTATAGGTATDIKAIAVTVNGTNILNQPITETLPVFTVDTAGTVTGFKAFKTITSIVIPAHDGVAATTAIGTSAKLGLPFATPRNTILRAYLNDVVEGTAPTVVASAAAVELNTVQLNSALNGTPVIVIAASGSTAGLLR